MKMETIGNSQPADPSARGDAFPRPGPLTVIALADLEYAGRLLFALRDVGMPFHVVGLASFRPPDAISSALSEVWLSHDEFHAPAMEREVRRIVRDTGVAASRMLLVTLRERSVDLVARVAEATGCAGLSRRCATLCRDKLAMQNQALQLGVAVPATRVLEDIWSADEMPQGGVVFKPRRGSTSIDVMFAATYADALNCLASIRNPQIFLAQEHVDGPTYFVSGVRRGGRTLAACLGKHIVPLAHVGKRPRNFLRSWITPLDGAIDPPLADIAEKMCAAHDVVASGFDLNDGCTHIEFFWRNGEPIFCEAAARAPGPRVLAMQQALLGETMIELFVRSLAMPCPTPLRPCSRYAGMLDVVAEGPVRSLVGDLPTDVPWILSHYRWDPNAVKGGTYTDPLFRVLIEAQSAAECEARLERLAGAFTYVLCNPS